MDLDHSGSQPFFKIIKLKTNSGPFYRCISTHKVYSPLYCRNTVVPSGVYWRTVTIGTSTPTLTSTASSELTDYDGGQF